MRTPAGTECSYFYGDYYRGRSREECRLLQAAGQRWTPTLCKTCPVPGIQRSNACEHLQLKASIGRPLEAAFRCRVQVSAWCQKTQRSVQEPHVGCGECHPLPFTFEVKEP